MEEGTGLELPWRTMKERLVKLEANGDGVLYSTTFEMINANNVSVSHW